MRTPLGAASVVSKDAIASPARSPPSRLSVIPTLSTAAVPHPCIVKTLLQYSGLPEREDRTPCPPLSGKACRVDNAPIFPILMREIGQYLWPDPVGSPH